MKAKLRFCLVFIVHLLLPYGSLAAPPRFVVTPLVVFSLIQDNAVTSGQIEICTTQFEGSTALESNFNVVFYIKNQDDEETAKEIYSKLSGFGGVFINKLQLTINFKGIDMKVEALDTSNNITSFSVIKEMKILQLTMYIDPNTTIPSNLSQFYDILKQLYILPHFLEH